jgi:hypothetical protein
VVGGLLAGLRSIGRACRQLGLLKLMVMRGGLCRQAGKG